MRHAILITIHKNFLILEQLMKVLDRSGIDFYILIDKKVNVRLKEVYRYTPQYSKIIELEPSKINWGGVESN